MKIITNPEHHTQKAILSKTEKEAYSIMQRIYTNHGETYNKLKNEQKAEFIIGDYVNDLIRIYLKHHPKKENIDEVFAILNKGLRKYLDLKYHSSLFIEELQYIFG